MLPERRLVERLVFPDQADAAAAKARLDAGETFETLVAERGLTLDDIDLGDRRKADLGAAGDAVFAADRAGRRRPAAVRPWPGAVPDERHPGRAGNHASKTRARRWPPSSPTDAARRAIADQVEAIDDLLAGGATLEDLADESGHGSLARSTMCPAPSDAASRAIQAFRDAADAVQDGDFPEADRAGDGGVVALRLDEIVPADADPV